MTSQQPPLTIDLHTHILPNDWPNLRKKYGYGGFVQLEHHKSDCARMMIDDKFFREIQSNCYNPETRVNECDELGVHVQVLSTVPIMFSYWAKPEHTLDLSRFLNDDIAQTVSQYPKRFVGLGTLPMNAPDLAVKELRRCVLDLGLRGVEIGSHIDLPDGKTWNLDAPELFPVFEEAERLGASIFVHPWDMMGKSRMEKYWLPWLVGMPAETSLAICSMIFSGIFDRLPALKIAFAHGGGSFPATIGRIEHGWACRPDLCARDCKRSPRDYLGSFYLDSLVHDRRMLKYVTELIGPEKVILGTDYPFPLGEVPPLKKPGELIMSADFDDATRAKLMGGNACDFLGIKAEDYMPS